MNIFPSNIVMNTCKTLKKMFSLITSQQNLNVLLRGFEYFKYVRTIKSLNQQGDGMGRSSQKTEIRLLEK